MPRSRSSASGFLQLIAHSVQPVYAVDESRCFVHCNAACASWLNVAEADLLGRRADFHSPAAPETPADAAVAALCPPPESFRGQRVRHRIDPPPSAADQRPRWGDFLPLLAEDGSVIGVVAFVGPGDDSVVDSDPRVTRGASELHRELRELQRQAAGRFRWDRLLGHAPVTQRALQLAQLSVDGRPNTVITGPVGSGREHLARGIHRARWTESDAPLVPLACPLLDAEHLELTVPRLSRATGSSSPPATLLLLEVDRLPSDAQQTLERLLATAAPPWRILATARRSLLELASEESFRLELAHQLETLLIELPALETRIADLPLLAQMFVEQRNAEGQRQWSGFTAEALDRLALYRWPGNLDELCDVVRQACEVAEGPFITVTDLPAVLHHAADVAAVTPRRTPPPVQLDELLADVERELFRRAMEHCRGNKAKAARWLGISRARMIRRWEQLGLSPPPNE